jgi:calcium/calmodulin-dependent protein kinase I
MTACLCFPSLNAPLAPQVELGRGVHAVVRIGTNKQTGEKVAVKCVEKANMRRRQLAREIQILTTVNHPNVISLKDVFEDDKTVYLVLELIEGGELFDRIVNDGAFSEQDAAKLVRKITEGLLHLHEHKVCHRDLKPENLLLTTKGSDADVKIADFGLSKVLGEKTMMKRSCGTWAYWAPEILRRQPYDYSVDLWSVGVILCAPANRPEAQEPARRAPAPRWPAPLQRHRPLDPLARKWLTCCSAVDRYIMLSGVHPFDPDGQSTDAQIVERILRADYTFEPEHWGHVSKEAMDVIRHLIHMDPMQRYTCKQLLQHPWVAGTDVSDSPMPSDALDSLRDFNRQRRNFVRTRFPASTVPLVRGPRRVQGCDRNWRKACSAGGAADADR